MSPLPLRHLWVLALCITLWPDLATSAEVSRRPPEIYHQEIAPLLTAAEDALATVESPGEHAAAGHGDTVILHEVLRRVETGGALLLVQHEIRRANTAEGVEDLAQVSFAFRSGVDRMHLALARTLLPDGTWGEVDSTAASIQPLDPDAEEGEGSKVQEMVVKFPQLQVGGAVEYIVVWEQSKPRIPGVFTALLTFDFFSPVGLSRQVVDLPVGLAEQMAIAPLGAVPKALRVDVGERRRISWQKTGSAALIPEPERAPLRHEGPAVWLSTLESWDAFAGWYRTLMVGRDLLLPALTAQVDAWTAQATSREQIIEILHRKVADEVRATRSEFETADLAPVPAAQVWQEGRGDGKDQAYLLRAFLRHKGIVSHLALLDRSHSGRLETRSPDYRHFDHAILAIEREDGGFRWSDPTVPHLGLDELVPGVADRPALVVRSRGYEIVHTPRSSSSDLNLEFDLALEPEEASAGSTSGIWGGRVAIEAGGVRGRIYRGWFADLEPADLKDRLQRYLGAFFGNSLGGLLQVEEVDLSSSPRAKFVLQASFSASEVVDGSRGGGLFLAHGGQVFRQLGSSGERQTSYFQALEESRVQLRYKLPTGWRATSLPPPFALEHGAFVASSSWVVEGDTLVGTLDYQQRRSQVSAEEYVEFARGLQELNDWTVRPVSVRAVPVAPPPPTLSPKTAIAEQGAAKAAPEPGSFAAAVANWVEEHGPPWLDFAEPKNLDDPRVGDPRQAIAAENTVFNLAEKFKIGLLAAQRGQEGDLPTEAFFSYSMLLLDELTTSWSAEREMLQAVMDNGEFSQKVQQEAYSRLLRNLFEAGLDDRLKQLLRHPLRNGLSVSQSKDLERLTARLEQPRKTTPQIEAQLLDLLAEPLARADQGFFGKYFRRLLNRGAFDVAERILQAMGGLQLAEGDAMDASRMRLELLQALGEARDQTPVLEALRRVTFAHFPAAEVSQPDFWQDLHDREAVDLMDLEVARGGRLWELSSGELDLRLLPWWTGSMLLLVDPGAERREFALETTLAAVRVAPDDETRLWFVLFGVDGVGADDRERRRRFHEGLVAWSDPQKHPMVAEALRVLEMSAALRQGKDPDLTEALVGLRQGIPRRIAGRLKVRQAFLKRDTARLRFLLGELPTEYLLEPRTLDLHLPALQWVGMTEQEAAARQAGERALYEAILRTWVKPERWDILLVFKLSEVLYGSPAYPKAWLEHCLENVASRRMQHLIRLLDAELNEAWEVALGHAEALWADDPESYDHAWAVGRAAYRLGLWAQARGALHSFVTHAHDHLRFPDAVEMLVEVEEKLQ